MYIAAAADAKIGLGSIGALPVAILVWAIGLSLRNNRILLIQLEI
jgi:glycerol uptake facilitator protein